MAVQKKVAKKRAAKKKAVASPKTDMVAKLRQGLKDAKAETSDIKKQLRESERKVAALLKLLERTQTDADKFLAARVKDAVMKYGIAIAPKKRRRRVAKKKVAPSLPAMESEREGW